MIPQVLTACLLSFAHGANDVANAIAPLSAVLTIYDQGGVSSKAPVQKWVLALGGLGIVVGLALYGYKLIISLGYRMTKVSPSRGFAIELSAAMVVVVASFVGIPISTTQASYFFWLPWLVFRSSHFAILLTLDVTAFCF